MVGWGIFDPSLLWCHTHTQGTWGTWGTWGTQGTWGINGNGGGGPSLIP